MSQSLTSTIKVPATTANIGPGFDCLGAALSLYNHFQFTLLPPTPTATSQPIIHASGPGAAQLPTDTRNLVYQAFSAVYQHLGQPTPVVSIDIHLDIPQARGLGSSATAIVAGILGANELANCPLEKSELLQLGINLEGHPDNVVPALMGGCCLATKGVGEDQWQVCPINWSAAIVPVVAIPDFELKTDLARNALPHNCSYENAIFNMAHLGFLIKGLEQADPAFLKTALHDQLHQPYRLPLIPGFTEAYHSALQAGAYGLVISGAGPTLLALCQPTLSEQVADTLRSQLQKIGIPTKTLILEIDRYGALAQTVTRSS